MLLAVRVSSYALGKVWGPPKKLESLSTFASRNSYPSFMLSKLSACIHNSIPFFSLWAGGIEQILQTYWFLKRAEFSHPDHHSERNPSWWSVFVRELEVNLSPSLHFHKQLINASLYLFTFTWQGNLLWVNSIEFSEVVRVCLAVCS